MGWMVWGSNPIGGEICRTIQNGPEAHPAFYAIGTRSLPGVKQPGHGIDHPPPIQQQVYIYIKHTKKNRAIPLLHSVFRGMLWTTLPFYTGQL